MSKTTKPKQSRFFRVAVEGATTDGRKIERAHLEQMAASYDRNTYSARISLEHIKGIVPDGPFKAYGDVTAVKAEEVTIAGKKKLALFAAIAPTDELVALNKKSQKLYTSIEIAPEFADTGEAYLVGLAITDNPASLGTEALEFCAQHPNANQWTARKADPGNVVTEALEFTLQMDSAGNDDGEDGDGAVAKFRAALATAVGKFKKKGASDDARFDAVADSLADLGEAFSAHAEDTAAQLQQATAQVQALSQELEGMRSKFAALDSTPTGRRRPEATGGTADAVTDC